MFNSLQNYYTSNPKTIDIFQSCIQGFYINNQNEKVQISDMINNCLINTKSYPPDYNFELPHLEKKENGLIEIRNETTIKGAYRMSVEEHKNNICALNFANAVVPGGGTLGFSNAQEESICRSSALFYSLIQKDDFYKYHKRMSNTASNYMIFSPDCPTWKIDNYEILNQPILVSFITSAAACNYGMYSREELMELHDKRIQLILYCAISNGVKNLILGAYGCGAFHNNPYDIANSFKHWLVDEKLKDYFETISFSIIERLDRKIDKKAKNIDVFASVFGLPIIKNMIKINVDFSNDLKNTIKNGEFKGEIEIPEGTKTGTLPALVAEHLMVGGCADGFLAPDGFIRREIGYALNGEDVRRIGVEVFLRPGDRVVFTTSHSGLESYA